MVDEVDIEEGRGASQLGGQADIRSRRSRVATGVVVSDRDGWAVRSDSLPKHLGDPDLGAVDASLIDGRNAFDTVFRIEDGDPKLCLLYTSDAAESDLV